LLYWLGLKGKLPALKKKGWPGFRSAKRKDPIRKKAAVKALPGKPASGPMPATVQTGKEIRLAQ